MTRERALRIAKGQANDTRKGQHILVVQIIQGIDDWRVVPVPAGCTVGHVRDILNPIGARIAAQFFVQATK